MSDESLDDPELRKAIRQATRRLQKRSEAERRALIQQAVEHAVNEELVEKREQSEREAAALEDVLTRDSQQEEARRARRNVPLSLLLLLLLLLILLLIAAAIGRTDLLPQLYYSATPVPTLQSQIPLGASLAPSLASSGSLSRNAGNMPGIGSLNQPTPEIGARFRAYYDQHGGERLFGRPLSPQMEVNGRTIQWFERMRLEDWPEYAGTPYQIQAGRLGAEFTKGIVFPQQQYFVGRSDLRYFAETGHGLGGRFLQFWTQNGGLDIFGYPISDQVQELLPDGQLYTVQYFERARLEYHPQNAGTAYEVQVGLLGYALYLNESKPNIIPPARPTAVPMP